jgi:hypothetical protein
MDLPAAAVLSVAVILATVALIRQQPRVKAARRNLDRKMAELRRIRRSREATVNRLLRLQMELQTYLDRIDELETGGARRHTPSQSPPLRLVTDTESPDDGHES